MRRNLIETILGGVVLVVAAFFLVFAYTSAGLQTVPGYEVVAKFDRIDGLEKGSDVRMSGIKIGTVLSQEIDPQTYLAVVRMSVDPLVKLPTDTAAEIAMEGLLGGKYMALVPGAEEKMIAPGGEIKFTQSPLNLDDIIGQLIFSKTEAEEKSGKPAEK